MKEKLFFLLLPLIAAAWLLACKKDPKPVILPVLPDYTVLPPATQTGANTFGCLVDGEVWVPRVPFGTLTFRAKESTVKESDGMGFGIITCNLLDLETWVDNHLYITFPSTFFKPTKFCGKIIGLSASLRTTDGTYYENKWGDISENCVEIINIDSSKNIVSGYFNFNLYKDSINLNNMIVISNGRFDMTYYPY